MLFDFTLVYHYLQETFSWKKDAILMNTIFIIFDILKSETMFLFLFVHKL